MQQGSQHTEETRTKISKSLKGCVVWNKNLTKKEYPQLARPMNAKFGLENNGFKKGHKQFNTGRTRFKKGYMPWNKGKNANDYSIEYRQKLRQNRLNQKFPLKDTKIEIMLQNALTERGIKFTPHKAILGQPDMFIEPNICIFIDGCWWHSCEECYDKNKFNNHQRYRIIIDTIVTQKLINGSYVVLRFWEHEINNNLEKVLNKIQENRDYNASLNIMNLAGA